MNMQIQRHNETYTVEKVLKRFNNLLNLVYLQARQTNKGYEIPSELFEKIQQELDFNPPENNKKDLEKAQKERYRKRKSYVFWKGSLDTANISDAKTAKEFLMGIYERLDRCRYYSSLTHSYYALETMQLAIDDAYDTNDTVLSAYKFVAANFPKPKKKKAKKSKKSPQKQAHGSTLNDDVPF
jgi:hypothetical protein